MRIIMILIFIIAVATDNFGQNALNEIIYFQHGKYEMTKEIKVLLDTYFKKINEYDLKKITIVGHTDDDGSDSYNLNLSEKRSRMVLNYLISQGIKKDKIFMEFYGENRPVSINEKLLEKHKNRSVELTFESAEFNKFEIANKKPQTFSIYSNRDTTIICSEGTSIKVKANSFVDEFTGEQIFGKVNFSVAEYYKISDIILYNLSTTSNGNLLETGGMLYISASGDSSNYKLKDGQSIEISFVNNSKSEEMQLFTGIWEPNNFINWNILPQKDNDLQFFSVVEEMPKFKGGEDKMFQYLANNIKYPKKSLELGIQGTVYISVVIDKLGNPKNPIVLKGLSPEIDLVAIEAIRGMPDWIPGKQNGVNVNVQYNIPVRFNINEDIGVLTSLAIEMKNNFQFVESMNDSTLQKVNTGTVLNYILNSNKLGWINCDRFINVYPKVNFAVNLESEYSNVKIIFDKYKSVMNGLPKNGNFTFEKVPANEKITIIAIKSVDDKLYLAIKNTVTSSLIEKNFDFQQVSKDLLKSEITKLDRLD